MYNRKQSNLRFLFIFILNKLPEFLKFFNIMDKTRIFIRDETDAPNNRLNMENENRRESTSILSLEHDTLDENLQSCTKFEPRTKHICKEGKEIPNKHLEKDKDGGLYRRIPDISVEIRRDEYEENIARQSADKVDFSSKKKTNNMNRILKYLRRVLNPIKSIRNIKLNKKKGKMLIASKFKSAEILLEEGKYIFKNTESNKIFEEKNMHTTKVKILEDTKSGITTEKKRIEPDMFAALEMQPESSVRSRDLTMPLSSTLSVFVPITEIYPEYRSQEEVLKHFKCYMQSKAESLERYNSYKNKEDSKPVLNSAIPYTEYNTRTPTESGFRNLEDSKNSASKVASQESEDFTKAEIKSATTQDSKKVTNKVSVAQLENSTTLIKPTKNIPRQRIVYNEQVEHRRGWVIQQIKDKEILLKFRIMEGKYSKDIETKMRCIEEAEDLQEETDELFDVLDNSEKAINLPNLFTGYSDSTQQNLLKSESRSKNALKVAEREPKRLSSLFYHIRNSSSSGFDNEKVFEKIDSNKLKAAYCEFLLQKLKIELESEKYKLNVKIIVDEFYLSLIHHSLKVKCKIPHTEIKYLEDYQNYVCNLKMAANENLNCLNTLIPQVTSLILPLMTYLSQSRKQIVQILTFLDQEQPEVFLEISDKNKTFFEEFCQRHFKN